VTAVLGVFIENRYPSRNEFISLSVLSVGVMLAVWEGTVAGSPTGIVLCCAATLCNGAMMVTGARPPAFLRKRPRMDLAAAAPGARRSGAEGARARPRSRQDHVREGRRAAAHVLHGAVVVRRAGALLLRARGAPRARRPAPQPSRRSPSCPLAVSRSVRVPQQPRALSGRQGPGAEGAGRGARAAGPAAGPRGGERRRERGAEAGRRGAQAGAFVAYLPAHMQGVAGILLVSSCLALAYNAVHATMIQRLSAVTTTVLGEAKIVALLALSALFLGARAPAPAPRAGSRFGAPAAAAQRVLLCAARASGGWPPGRR